jgi:RNA polymerase sigma factor (sigma-70 family)
MANDKWHDEGLFSGIQQGDAQAWSHLVDQYQGRLLRYARARLLQNSDAEDLVQDTFVSFIKGLRSFRGQCSIETYLFLLLRHEIINRFRSRWAKSICLLQDIAASSTDSQPDAMTRISDPEASVSRNIQQREDQERQQEALTKALKALLERLKQKLKFQNLMIIELLFYAGLSNKKTAELLGIDVGNVGAVKHRSLRRLRQSLITDYPAPDESTHYSDDMMRSIWASRRLSCPKRSTLGAFMLQELDPAWFEYVHFHLAILGCHFCRASFKDLQCQQDREQQVDFRQKILASTIGFLTSQ